MNDQQIYECIALNGPMTAEAIAGELRAEVGDTIEHLAALRGVGDLVLTNGVYSFSRGFTISEDCRRARAKAAATQQGRDGAGECITDRALNFLIARGGRCTSWEMHAALGLGADELPSVVLADALVSGRLFKEGKEWFLDRRSSERRRPSDEEMFAEGVAISPARAVPLTMPIVVRVIDVGEDDIAPVSEDTVCADVQDSNEDEES